MRLSSKNQSVSAPSPLDEGFLSTIEKASEEFWRGVPVVPVMGAAGSDGTYLRNAGIPTYGHSGLAGDVDDVRAHGKDERVAVKSFREGSEYLYRLVKRLSGGNYSGFRSFRITLRMSSPGLSRQPRSLEHGAGRIEVAGTSPATTRGRWQVVQYDREPL